MFQNLSILGRVRGSHTKLLMVPNLNIWKVYFVVFKQPFFIFVAGNQIPLFDALIKHDLETGSMKIHRFGPGRYGGEPMFVPRTKKSVLHDLGISLPLSPPATSRNIETDVPKTVFENRVPKKGDDPLAKPHVSWSYKQIRDFLSRLYDRASVRDGGGDLLEEGEDCGWLLVHVWDEDAGQSEVVVIDAQNVEGPPVARVVLPSRVPFGFHGTFIPSE